MLANKMHPAGDEILRLLRKPAPKKMEPKKKEPEVAQVVLDAATSEEEKKEVVPAEPENKEPENKEVPPAEPEKKEPEATPAPEPEKKEPEAKEPENKEPPAKEEAKKTDDDEKEVMDSASDYSVTDLRIKAGAVVQEWAITTAEDLGENETMADRLLAMVVGVIDSDKDGEITEEEAELAEVVINAVWDYLTVKGTSDEDCAALLNDWSPEAADRIKDLLASSLPTDDEAAGSDLDAFAFDEEAEQSVFDAVYKKRMVVRKGKKVRINKRISGHVRLSAKQKVSVRKMLRKSHSARASMRRMKSMRVRSRSGL
jgi:hypothetical protein